MAKAKNTASIKPQPAPEPLVTERVRVQIDDPIFVEKLRAWRKLRAEKSRIELIFDETTGEKLVTLVKRIDEKESEARKEIGNLLGAPCTGVVDDKMLMYKPTERTNPFDDRFKVAWLALMEVLPPSVREIADKLLPDPKMTTIHTLITEE